MSNFEAGLAEAETTSRFKNGLRAAALAAGSLILAASGANVSSDATTDNEAGIQHSTSLQNNEVVQLETTVVPAAVTSGQRSAKKPNVIFILADDLSSNELQYMPNTRRYIFQQGATFDNYFANVSLCCSARASIFTGQYAHNTGIVSNVWPGGFYGYEKRGIAERSFPYDMKKHGINTTLTGKYLNGFVDDPYYPGKKLPPNYVPKGWTNFAVPTKGQYFGNNYQINVNGKMHHNKAPHDFLSDYTNRLAIQLINKHKNGGLFIEMSDFGPHDPAPSSPIEKHNPHLRATAAHLYYPRTASFNEANVSDKPAYIRNLRPLNSAAIKNIDRIWRARYFSVKTLDRHVGQLVQALRHSNQLQNTYLVFASDNGYHMGEHRLVPGKNTEFDTDIKLPFGISGPGIRPYTHVKNVVGNIDIAPTVLALEGLKPLPSMDGESLVPLMHHQQVPWRSDYFIQKGIVTPYNRANGILEPGSPAEQKSEMSVTGFIGDVDSRYRLFWYNDGKTAMSKRVDGQPFRPGEKAFYDTVIDPLELNNLMAKPQSEWTPSQQAAYARLGEALMKLTGCRGPVACRD